MGLRPGVQGGVGKRLGEQGGMQGRCRFPGGVEDKLGVWGAGWGVGEAWS